MNKTTLTIAIVAVAVIGGAVLFRGGYQAPQETNTQPQPSPKEAVLPSAAKEINMTSGNFFFSPAGLNLTKGQPVKITFKNSGFHTFTIDELGVDVQLSGDTASVEFTPAKSGSFEYYCAVPGHRESGMLGSLTVN